MVSGWLPGASARWRWGGVYERAWRGWLLPGCTARCLGAQVCTLSGLAGDASALVVQRGAAVEVFTDLDSGAGVGAALRARPDSDGTALERDDVVHADCEPVAKTEDVHGTFASRQAAVG